MRILTEGFVQPLRRAPDEHSSLAAAFLSRLAYPPARSRRRGTYSRLHGPFRHANAGSRPNDYSGRRFLSWMAIDEEMLWLHAFCCRNTKSTRKPCAGLPKASCSLKMAAFFWRPSSSDQAVLISPRACADSEMPISHLSLALAGSLVIHLPAGCSAPTSNCLGAGRSRIALTGGNSAAARPVPGCAGSAGRSQSAGKQTGFNETAAKTVSRQPKGARAKASTS
jgi:hypothetical protein